MAINRLNYEAYAIDFLEGNLSAPMRKEMEAFLLKNPDIKKELEGLTIYILPEEELPVFEGKADLIQPIPIQKKDRKIIPLWISLVAAALLGGLVVFTFLNKSDIGQSLPVVEKEQVKPIQPAPEKPVIIEEVNPEIAPEEVVENDTKPKKEGNVKPINPSNNKEIKTPRSPKINTNKEEEIIQFVKEESAPIYTPQNKPSIKEVKDFKENKLPQESIIQEEVVQEEAPKIESNSPTIIEEPMEEEIVIEEEVPSTPTIEMNNPTIEEIPEEEVIAMIETTPHEENVSVDQANKKRKLIDRIKNRLPKLNIGENFRPEAFAYPND